LSILNNLYITYPYIYVYPELLPLTVTRRPYIGLISLTDYPYTPRSDLIPDRHDFV